MADAIGDVFGPWRARARRLLEAGVPPDRAQWCDDAQHAIALDDGSDEALAHRGGIARVRIAPGLLELLETCACHRDPARYALMYRVLWRAVNGEHDLADDRLDPDVVRLAAMAKAVRRDAHKMTAFVRFRALAVRPGDVEYVAWYVPEHHILRRAAPFFARRFGTMTWTIATPDGAAHWDRRTLLFLPTDAVPAPVEDAAEALWLTYYRNIFNPARLNVRAMQREMPQKYWRNVPESRLVPALIAGAAERSGRMVDGSAPFAAEPRARASRIPVRAAPPAPSAPAPDSLEHCRRCELWEHATRAVPGEGPPGARIMLVGEQPGDEEDLAGRPFVGPAGRLLRSILGAAGLDAGGLYVTNSVKHFFFEPRGKRRIHKTPLQRHVAACVDWLEREIAHVKPATIVTLGATALAAVHGTRLAVGAARGRELRHASGARIVATYHPSALLRAPDDATRARLEEALRDDLARAAAMADEGAQ